ncbi:MAG: hypothetical protein E7577_04535 [Ruminococcaceae bacterium]|nr:hypothetical protein [Oscillospiraceae bacterium]
MSQVEAKSFILYNNFWNVFALLSMEQRGELVTAIFEYERLGHLTAELSPYVAIAFAGIKDTLTRDRAAYAEKCEKNAANAKKGGRPKKTSTEAFAQETERFFEKPYNDNDNRNGNENDNKNNTDIAIDSGSGMDISACAPQGNKPPTEQNGGLSSLPLGSASPSSAPRLDSENKARLISFGLTHEYIAAREKRAIAYAKKNAVSVYDVLISWWKADVKQKRVPPSAPQNSKSEYAEEWLAALVNIN